MTPPLIETTTITTVERTRRPIRYGRNIVRVLFVTETPLRISNQTLRKSNHRRSFILDDLYFVIITFF